MLSAFLGMNEKQNVSEKKMEMVKGEQSGSHHQRSVTGKKKFRKALLFQPNPQLVNSGTEDSVEKETMLRKGETLEEMELSKLVSSGQEEEKKLPASEAVNETEDYTMEEQAGQFDEIEEKVQKALIDPIGTTDAGQEWEGNAEKRENEEEEDVEEQERSVDTALELDDAEVFSDMGVEDGTEMGKTEEENSVVTDSSVNLDQIGQGIRKKTAKGMMIMKGISSKKRNVQALVSPRKKTVLKNKVQIGKGLYQGKAKPKPSTH